MQSSVQPVCSQCAATVQPMCSQCAILFQMLQLAAVNGQLPQPPNCLCCRMSVFTEAALIPVPATPELCNPQQLVLGQHGHTAAKKKDTTISQMTSLQKALKAAWKGRTLQNTAQVTDRNAQAPVGNGSSTRPVQCQAWMYGKGF